MSYQKTLKVSMLGAGSGFVLSIAKELNSYDIFTDTHFVMMDINNANLELAKKKVIELIGDNPNNITVTTTTSMPEALDGCDYVISSCEKNRYPYWVKDFQIPENHGVHQLKAENGGPGGIIHAMRNISMFMDITKEMEKRCPNALLMNFTNPMSMLCTYLNNYSPIRNLGFCHQVHGAFGVISEMLGFEPGELEVVSAGINHLNWLFDIRRRNSSKSYMKEFIEGVENSKYWKEKFDNIPPPFPKNDEHPYYAEAPCKVIMALETNTPTYFDAIVIPNNGAIGNLPENAILDVPALAIGGEVRSIHVGDLPMGPLEICRRQIAIHEMVAKATYEGDDSLAIQAFCLDPYVNSITQAQNIWRDFKKEYNDDLPTFQ